MFVQALAFVLITLFSSLPGIAAALVVNTGKATVTAYLIGSAPNQPKYVAWGTGAGTAAATDTTLFTEASESRTSGTATQQTTTTTSDTHRVVGAITVATADKTITNVGIFDASTSGNLYFKANFTGLPLVVGDVVTWTINVVYA